jgi:hypothetical protein
LALRKATLADIARLWPALDFAALDRTYPGLLTAVAAVVARNRHVSAGLAAAYLRAFRVAQGITGDLRIVVPPLSPEQLQTSLHVTSVVAVKKSVERGDEPTMAMGHALAQVSGAMARLVLNGGRDTITATGKQDPRASGWRWVLGGSSHCDFCLERAGQVFDDSAEFHSHDTCGCTPELAYR